MKNIDPKVSEFFREMAKKRKNPYHGFSDPEKAREAGRKGAEKRWHVKGEEKDQNEIPGPTQEGG